MYPNIFLGIVGEITVKYSICSLHIYDQEFNELYLLYIFVNKTIL